MTKPIVINNILVIKKLFIFFEDLSYAHVGLLIIHLKGQSLNNVNYIIYILLLYIYIRDELLN